MIHPRRIAAKTNRHNRFSRPSSKNDMASRPVSPSAWWILVLSALATFFSFILLDPNPNLLLSLCAAANVAIMLAAIYRLYLWDLLLSPMMIAFIGPALIPYYSWGNLGARIAGEARYAANWGTLDYYPQIALLSTIGLLLYYWLVFGVFQESFRRVTIRYQDLSWQPQQAVVAIGFCFLVLLYLSTKYDFIGGYFRGATSDFDRWLIAVSNSFVLLVVIISVSVLAKSQDKGVRVLALLGIVVALTLAVGLRSRTFMLMVLILITLCWFTLNPKHMRASSFFMIGLVTATIFSLGSAVKFVQGETTSIADNLYAVSSLEASQVVSLTTESLETDRQYRTGGFEYPAAILRCLLDNGASPAYGDGVTAAFLQGLPGFLRPEGVFAERGGIARHYWRHCFFYDDAMAIPLASGLGDWGILGVFIYGAAALFSLGLWRVVQTSPRLFVAFLLVPYFPDNLFWTGAFTFVKMMAFLWLLLWLTGPLIMPRWIPSTDQPTIAETSHMTRVSR